MSTPEQASQVETVDTVTAELRLALENFLLSTHVLIEATEKAGKFIPEEILQSADGGEGTDYHELYKLWVMAPGEEVLTLLGAQE